MLNQLQQISEQIKKAKSILIAYSQSFNSDGIASALALFLFLQKLKKNVEIVTDDQQNCLLNFKQQMDLNFLPAYNQIKNSINDLRELIVSLDIMDVKIKKIKYEINNNILNFIISPQKGFLKKDNIVSSAVKFKYDLIIVLNTPDLESLGQIYNDYADFFYEIPIINIDHCPENEGFGQINCIELTALSSSEILFSLFENLSFDLIDEDIATCLLTGIICSTKNFKTFNITPNILSTTSRLLSINARREEIVNHLYRSLDLNTLKLWGRVLARLSSTSDSKLIWSVVCQKDFVITNSNEKNLINIIDELIINIPQAEIIVIIYETLPASQVNSHANNQSKIVVYSTKNINSMDLMKEYNPNGSQKLVQITINKPILEAEKEIIEFIKNKLNKLLRLE